MSCQLCERDIVTNEHHLVPRQKGGRRGDKVNLCYLCHGQIHAFFTNGELKRAFNTLDKIRQDPRVQKYLAWLAKHPHVYRFNHFSQDNNVKR